MAQGVPALGVAVGLQDLGDKQVPARAKGDSRTGGGVRRDPKGSWRKGRAGGVAGSEKGSPPAALQK